MTTAHKDRLTEERARLIQRLVTDFDSPLDGWATAYARRVAGIDRDLADDDEHLDRSADEPRDEVCERATARARATESDAFGRRP